MDQTVREQIALSHGAAGLGAGPMRPTVLVVDDDPTVTDHFSRILRLEGYDVSAAYGPEQGLSLVEHLRPDAMVLDLQMRAMDGLELLGRFRTMPHLADVPAVIVTGDYFMDDEIRSRLGALGAQVEFKPLWVEDLVRVVNSLAARSKLPHAAA